MLEVVIILMEVIKKFVEVVKNFVEIVINLSEMVRRVAGRSWGIIWRVVGMATVKDRTRGAAGSVASIGGVVVVATADYTLLIYIGGRVGPVGRSINTMVRRSSMLGGRGCVMGRRINIMLGRGSMVVANAKAVVGRVGSMVGRVGSAVGRVRIKAIKKGSTEVLPLDVLLI